MRMTRGRFHAILIGCLLLLPAQSAVGLVHFDFEHMLFTEPPQPILDHCVVEENGVYHLFYLRGNPAVNIGHATTTDFIRWQTLPPVMNPGTWDNHALWAPHIIREPTSNWWFMYYTGVNNFISQQSGVAFSQNLDNWFKWPNPIYRPDTQWAEWTPTGFAHGRDPHILFHNGYYYMFVTAKTNTNRGAVACARSTNLIDWEDIGPVFVNTSWHVLESVFVLQHEGRWHMFFTEETVGGATNISSDSLLSGWEASPKRIVDLGHAPQITNTHLGEMYSRHTVFNDGKGNFQYVIRFTPMVWLGQIPAVPKPLPLQGRWIFTSGDALYYQPTWGHNAAVRNDNYPKTWVGDGWINTYEYYTGPIGFGGPGAIQGDSRIGTIRSQAFTITGNSMSLLVGGGNYPAECYVALVDSLTGTQLFSETGNNTNELSLRRWDLRPFANQRVYVEIADLSVGAFGHICVDEIVESYDVYDGGNYTPPDGNGSGHTRKRPAADEKGAPVSAQSSIAQLHGNVPNPFNPVTAIVYELPSTARVQIDIFDATGARIRTLLDERRDAGLHRAEWNGTDSRGTRSPSGVYFYRLRIDGTVLDTRKMVLLK
jgi:hypothetical protein